MTLSYKGTDDKNNLIFHWNPDIDIWWEDIIENSSDNCEPTWLDAEDPLFILYTR